jgi:hypothetical protein
LQITVLDSASALIKSSLFSKHFKQEIGNLTVVGGDLRFGLLISRGMGEKIGGGSVTFEMLVLALAILVLMGGKPAA